MQRLFKSVTYPKNYENNCKFVEHIKKEYPSEFILSLPEEKEFKKNFCRQSTFTKIFATLKNVDSFQFGIIYTFQDGHSIYLRLIKENELLKIFLIEPTGVNNASQWLSIIADKLFVASSNTHQSIIVYLNPRELQHSREDCPYFSQYFAEYFLKNDSSCFNLPHDNFEINSCINKEFLPKALLITTQSLTILQSLFASNEKIQTNLNEPLLTFSAFEKNYCRVNSENKIQNHLIKDYGKSNENKTKNIKIEDPVAYCKNSVDKFIQRIEEKIKWSAVL